VLHKNTLKYGHTSPVFLWACRDSTIHSYTPPTRIRTSARIFRLWTFVRVTLSKYIACTTHISLVTTLHMLELYIHNPDGEQAPAVTKKKKKKKKIELKNAVFNLFGWTTPVTVEPVKHCILKSKSSIIFFFFFTHGACSKSGLWRWTRASTHIDADESVYVSEIGIKYVTWSTVSYVIGWQWVTWRPVNAL